ncbi:MAG: ornithine cyclodeaminase family protein, partial [Dermatophilaceae bacterium]
MRTVDRATVMRLVSYPDAVDAMRRAFATVADRRAEMPDEFLMRHPVSGEVHVKGAHLHGSAWMVAKLVSGGFAIGGNHGCSFVLSAESGAIEVLIDDGGWLTEIRTAAAGALTVDVLARKDASSLAILGSGIQAQFQLDALRSILPRLGDIRVAGRTAAHVREFARRNDCVAAASIAEAVDGADVIVCATTSRAPIVERIAPGVHVTSVGVDVAGK